MEFLLSSEGTAILCIFAIVGTLFFAGFFRVARKSYRPVPPRAIDFGAGYVLVHGDTDKLAQKMGAGHGIVSFVNEGHKMTRITLQSNNIEKARHIYEQINNAQEGDL